jgi:16S rRNA C967 or C1407 C5-methylase (RsmB/RsmF family)/NOL1/NOP2/fmu family ribosome biogenesis protein
VHFPKGFTEHLSNQPYTTSPTLLGALDEPAPVSIRFNSRKLTDAFEGNDKVPWCPHAVYLEERPLFYLDPFWHAGAYYVQEASSMFIHWLLEELDIPAGSSYLDLCAAPGGKSTLIADGLQKGDLLVANETIRTRNAILQENITRWGHPQVMVTRNDPSRFGMLGPVFDVVVVDAPCSGSGLFRKDPDAVNEWSAEHVLHCAARQERIVQDVLPSLKPGGFLLYSTCSFSKEENEDITDFLCDRFPLETVHIHPPKEWGILESTTEKGHTCFRLHPDRVKGEGFFVAVFQSTGAIASENEMRQGRLPQWSSVPDGLIANQNDFRLLAHVNELFMVPEAIAEKSGSLYPLLDVTLPGIAAATRKGDQLIPSHGLAMSPFISTNYPDISLDHETALRYLRRETITSEDGLPLNYKGWATVSYKGVRLGWIKKIPQRINNYYPMGYRLRK